VPRPQRFLHPRGDPLRRSHRAVAQRRRYVLKRMGVRSRALSAGTRAAAAAFACYVAMAWLVGERFPFSRFSMYASLGTYRQSHVPVFLADGHPAEARSFHRFAGIDPEVIAPGTRICSLNHRIDE